MGAYDRRFSSCSHSNTCPLAGHADAEARRSVLTVLPCATLVTVPTSLGPTVRRSARTTAGSPPAATPRPGPGDGSVDGSGQGSVDLQWRSALYGAWSRFQSLDSMEGRAGRDWCLIAEPPAPAPHLSRPEGRAALHVVLVTVRVSRSCEHVPDRFDLLLLQGQLRCPCPLANLESFWSGNCLDFLLHRPKKRPIQ